MSVSLNVNGVVYQYPERGDNGWGVSATNWASAVTTGMLQKAGGLFLLAAEVDFGQNFGVKSLYIKSRTSNPASAGQIRLARADVINWRNEANDANLSLGVNSDDEIEFNGQTFSTQTLTVADTATIALSIDVEELTAAIRNDSITNAMINAGAAIDYSKLDLSGSIVNADINASAAIAQSKLSLSITNSEVNASAAIALSKLAALSNNIVPVTNGSGVITSSSTSATELGYLAGVTSSIQTQLDAKLDLAGGTMSGALTLAGDPSNALEAATKQYVDTVAQGLNAKASVIAATTGNITLSGNQTIDGVSITAGMRVLVKNQSTASQNGIYVSSASSWARSADANTWAELVSAFVFVSQGSTQADTGWVCTVDPGGTLGSTAVTFVQFSSAGIILAGNGLTKTGNTLDVNVDNSTIEISSNNLRVKDLGITAAKIANTTITNAQISASAAIAYSKLSLTGSIVNADISASAGIALSKIAASNTNRLVQTSGSTLAEAAAITAARALISDSNGIPTHSSVTSTELGYVAGVTSAIQTQLNLKMTDPMTTNGDIITRAAGVPARVGIGTEGYVLTVISGQPSWQGNPGAQSVVTPGGYPFTAASQTIILVDTSAARQINLPSPALSVKITIKDAAGMAQSNNITVHRAGSELIDGVAADRLLSANWGAWTFVSNGTNWFMC